MLAYHGLDGLSELFIFKHQRQHTEAYYLRALNDLLVHRVQGHEETDQKELGVKAVLDEGIQLCLYQGLWRPQAAGSELIVHIVEVLLLQKLQKGLGADYVLCEAIVVRVLFHQELGQSLPGIVKQVDLVEKQLQLIDIELLLQTLLEGIVGFATDSGSV